MFLAIFVNWFILPFYVSGTLQVNAKVLGFLLMLMPVLGAVTSPIDGWLSVRMAPAYLTTLALIVVAATMFWFTLLGKDSTVAQAVLRMAAVGFGMGMFQAANATLIMSAVPSNSLGTGGALLAMSRSMGTVFSVALMGALFASQLDLHTITSAQQTVTEKGGHGQAVVLAFKDSYLVSSILALIAVLVSFYVWPGRQRRRQSDSI